jgi:putative zinc finger/helix-turn-helix YgiT family protein
VKCIECGGAMKTTRKDHLYVESGLPNVLLQDIEFRTCPACGQHEMVIPRMAQLHRALAETIAEKRERLTGAEIKFLRKHLGWSGEDFAKTMGVRPESVSRWENEKEPMGATAERLLRLMALRGRPIDAYPNERLADVAQGDPKPARLNFKPTSSGWKPDTRAA